MKVSELIIKLIADFPLDLDIGVMRAYNDKEGGYISEAETDKIEVTLETRDTYGQMLSKPIIIIS